MLKRWRGLKQRCFALSTTSNNGPSPFPCAFPAHLQGIVTLQNCSAGYICAPLSRQQLAVSFGSSLPLAVGDIGACVYAPAVTPVCWRVCLRS